MEITWRYLLISMYTATMEIYYMEIQSGYDGTFWGNPVDFPNM